MKSKPFKSCEEWFSQVDYDLETAKFMYKTGRYIYVFFMCHLAVEKALKGIYAKVAEKDAPKTHDLSYLVEIAGQVLPKELNSFTNDLNELSVPTRYPDHLREILKLYKKADAKKMIDSSEEVILWLKKKL